MGIGTCNDEEFTATRFDAVTPRIFPSGFAALSENREISEQTRDKSRTKERTDEPDSKPSFPTIPKSNDHDPVDDPGTLSSALPLCWQHEADDASRGAHGATALAAISLVCAFHRHM